MAKPMTVKKLRKKLEGLPDHLIVAFETNEIPDSSWSVDKVENRFGSFCILKSVGEPGSLKIIEIDSDPIVRYRSPIRYGPYGRPQYGHQ